MSEGDDTWDITTFNIDLKNRLRKIAARHSDLCKLNAEDKELGSVSYTVQKSRVSDPPELTPKRSQMQGGQREQNKAIP